MKLMFFVAAVGVLVVLYGGYYYEAEDAEIKIVLFVKKYPALKMSFRNVHANDGDILPLGNLTEQERQWVIEYCHYRLGVDTELKTQADVEVCSKR